MWSIWSLRRALRKVPVDELVEALRGMMTPELRVHLLREIMAHLPERECEYCQKPMWPRERRRRCLRCRRLCCSVCRTAFGPPRQRVWCCSTCQPRYRGPRRKGKHKLRLVREETPSAEIMTGPE